MSRLQVEVATKPMMCIRPSSSICCSCDRQIQHQRTTMKLLSAFALLAWTQSASGFSAVAPKAAATKATGSPDPVDKSMLGIDQAGSFDPTEGENAALKRNNVGEVWVPQVRRLPCFRGSLARTIDQRTYLIDHTLSTVSCPFHSEHVLAATARAPP